MFLQDVAEQLFAWQLVLRLEHFLRDCPTYHSAWRQRVAAVLAYNTLFAYIYFGLTSLAHRSWRIVALWSGLLVLALEILALNALTSPLRQGPAPCAYATPPRLSEEAAVLMYFSGFYWLHTLVLAPTHARLWGQLVLLLCAWVISLWPLVYLDLHAPSAVLAGTVAGLGSALLSFAVFHWVHQRRHFQAVACCLRVLKVEPEVTVEPGELQTAFAL